MAGEERQIQETDKQRKREREREVAGERHTKETGTERWPGRDKRDRQREREVAGVR